MSGQTAYNKRYTWIALFGQSSLRSARSVASLAPTPHYGTFLQPWSCFASPYSGCKNVVYLERYMPLSNYIKYGIIKYNLVLEECMDNDIIIIKKIINVTVFQSLMQKHLDERRRKLHNAIINRRNYWQSLTASSEPTL